MSDLIMRPFDPVGMAIERLRQFEPPEGYYLAFSGGKDSQCIYHLAKEAGVKFDAHYNLTTVDPPELVYFIRDNYPDVEWNRPKMSMWELIVKKKQPPTRMVRYCCEVLKEDGGEGRFVVTGVRWAESSKRKKNRAIIEVLSSNREKKMLMNDNDEARRMLETCIKKGKRILNPIVDWEENDVWGYLKSRHIGYCSLYDEGFKRIGCIGCPVANSKNMQMEFKRWPKYSKLYLKAFERMLKYNFEETGIETRRWKTAQDVMNWWIYEMPKEDPGQLKMFDEDDF